MGTNSYEEYERECERIRKVNDGLLMIFETDLREKKLSEKTIRKHVDNADLLINNFLLREDALTMEHGIEYVDSFFYFFIHKCMWSTPASVKGTAASLKKFYQSMMNHAHISQEDYTDLCTALKEGVPVWQEECAEYNDSLDDLW